MAILLLIDNTHYWTKSNLTLSADTAIAKLKNLVSKMNAVIHAGGETNPQQIFDRSSWNLSASQSYHVILSYSVFYAYF
jgi:hypothetical protein